MKARTAGPEKSSITRQRLVNKIPRQSKYAPASTIPGLSPDNSLLNMSGNNGRISGCGVLVWCVPRLCKDQDNEILV
jgi:hypothetical protein